jgi:hypothetical protein
LRFSRELWKKGLYVELHAYQHHVFMDWRFVEDARWGEILSTLNGAGVASMQGRFDEMFGVKEEVVVEGKVKRTTAKTLPKKGKIAAKKTISKKPTVKKTVTKKVVKETKKTTTEKKPVTPKKSVKKLPGKATKSTVKAVGMKVKKRTVKNKLSVKKPVLRKATRTR